ncbi:hypothetical protein CAI21_10180 [Alkalilimnicola ehrlichii]|uniref:Uncharacterized protein n=1 Tax=Alkalilimnicola ehrlichii TaxID=351052 RepID=A0A3E0WJ92_9GAMM|nr:DUF6351 family protein [Alkalilimnicola ehrlichii]RFA29418.1 hypothetical protein CAI21_10180 [Alkalilimnicola ehrlichii]RFA31935.1 hypothetical protein CAL65_21025 [Alkalilimnicola ehrlichii]
MSDKNGRARLPFGACLCAALLIAGCDGSSDDNNNGSPGNGATAVVVDIRTLSNRADLISGGDALVEIVLDNASAALGALAQEIAFPLRGLPP